VLCAETGGLLAQPPAATAAQTTEQGTRFGIPSLEEALASKQDLWGLKAMQQPNGPAYEFFESLLPPLRYVNAAFRHYPIVLSAPGSEHKARLVSNGSALNARADAESWHEFGLPVTFQVGTQGESFGAELKRLWGPRYEKGYLPVVQMSYQHDGAGYQQESFAGVEPRLAEYGLVFVRFRLAGDKPGRVAAHLMSAAALSVSRSAICNTNGDCLVSFSDNWQWDAVTQSLTVNLSKNQSATLAIPTRPIPANVNLPRLPGSYPEQHEKCVRGWEALLRSGTSIEVPEPRVNDAWRTLVASLFTLTKGDRLNYSAGNSYERQFEAECGDAVGALLLYGFGAEAGRLLPPLMDYAQDGLGFHDKAFKLQLLSQYFWLTRNTNFVAALRPRWEPAANRILDGREAANGLLPRENYCGDIDTQVYSLNSNANSWRALRDVSALFEAMGESGRARDLRDQARSFRNAILAAVDKSERREVQPPFIPIALFGEEKPSDRLTDSKLGSYWNLMAPYILGSGVFGPGAPRERAVVDYLHEHGGVCLGLIRFHQHSGLFANEDGLDDLYGLRYNLTLLRLDEVDRALVSFYGKLAQGLTRDTCIGGEGTGLRPLDGFGRPMYLPPDCTAQASFLWTLRYLLIQDWDLDDDGTPETLRLGFATPKRWLADGNTIRVQNAPTAFGPVSFSLKSRLSHGEVLAELDLPSRNPPKQVRLRVRLPDHWRITDARVGSKSLTVDEQGTVDVSRLTAKAAIRFSVRSGP
jgi:hypothetical protein